MSYGGHECVKRAKAAEFLVDKSRFCHYYCSKAVQMSKKLLTGVIVNILILSLLISSFKVPTHLILLFKLLGQIMVGRNIAWH